MSRYSREEVKKWKEVFQSIDVNNDRRIDTKEFIEGAKGVGIVKTDEDAAEFIAQFDNNNSGTVEFSEFLKVLGEKGT